MISKVHARSEVFDRIKEKLNEIKETDKSELLEKGKMLKTLLNDRRMRSLKLSVNMNELAPKYSKSLMYITVRDIMTYKESVADTPMDTGLLVIH